jgi:hypothetical protein
LDLYNPKNTKTNTTLVFLKTFLFKKFNKNQTQQGFNMVDFKRNEKQWDANIPYAK